jgi:hypothetical protein
MSHHPYRSSSPVPVVDPRVIKAIEDGKAAYETSVNIATKNIKEYVEREVFRLITEAISNSKDRAYIWSSACSAKPYAKKVVADIMAEHIRMISGLKVLEVASHNDSDDYYIVFSWKGAQ